MSQLHLDNEDYRWLVEALGGPGTGSPHRALAWPSAAAPELFIPLESSATGAAALHRFHDGRTRGELAKTLAAMSLARLGVLRWAPGQSVDIGPFELVDRIAEDLDEDDLVLGVTLGPRRRNRKPVIQLLRRDGTTIGFAKVGWSPLTRSLVENEARWLTCLRGALPSQIQTPSILSRIIDGDRTVVVVSALDTSARSGIAGQLSPETIVQMARSLGTERRRVAELPYLDELRRGRVGALIDIDRLVDRHDDALVELGVWHGDLTPWNSSTFDGITRLWDWEFADEHRPVGFDLLHNTFESVRRRTSHNERQALDVVQDRTAAILASTDQPAGAAFDLYLCELIMREARLQGEGWDPGDLGPLEGHAAAMLRQRLT